MSMILLSVLLSLCLLVSAELPDDSQVTAIRQNTACPTVFCPWNCERFIDQNGCLYCGSCGPKTKCPPIKCPNLPHFVCVARMGLDGCTVCKCKARSKSVCGPTPMCSADCSITRDDNGCERCYCPPRPTEHCPESADAPCQHSNCWRERGADGCYHCICSGDVHSCPEVWCDPNKKCTHTIDPATGCATGCQCEVDNSTNVIPSRLIRSRMAPSSSVNKVPLRSRNS